MQLHVDLQQKWVRTSTDQSFSGFWTRWCLDSPCWHTPVTACKTQCDDYSLHRESKMFHTNFMFELREKHYQSRHTDNNTAHSTVLSFWVLGLSLSALLIVGVSLNAPSGKVFKTITAVLSQQHFWLLQKYRWLWWIIFSVWVPGNELKRASVWREGH